MENTDISVIIPVFNEEKNIRPLYDKLHSVLMKTKKSWEIIFIDDGSIDGSNKNISTICQENPRVKIIKFIRNFGQTAAFAAGFENSRGKILITIDSDLQNDPADIPRMINLLEKNKADIVCGWRKNRKDPLFRKILSNSANILIRKIIHTKIHDLGCSFRVYKKEAIKDVKLYGEMHRFIPILAENDGAIIIETEVLHHPRTSGKSKYGLQRTLKVLLDLVTVKYLTNYQTKPIYMFGCAGITFVFFSFFITSLILIRYIFLKGVWVSPMLFVATTLFNAGIICILMGLLAEIQIRTWYENSGKKEYIIKK